MRLPGVPVRILAAAVALALVLTGLVVREGLARAQGQEVLLPIGGADPRSILSGHYLQFRLADDVPDAEACAGLLDAPEARRRPLTQTTWVALRREGAIHRAVGAAQSREAALRKGDVALRGEVACVVFQDASTPGKPLDVSATLDIGIDRFHADQAEAQRLERALVAAPDGAAYAVVSVGRDGKARLKGLVLGGRRTDLDWF